MAEESEPGCERRRLITRSDAQVKLLLWLILFVLCWPLALLALVLYPIVWLVLLPFRLVGIAVDGAFQFLKALLLLPARALGARV